MFITNTAFKIDSHHDDCDSLQYDCGTITDCSSFLVVTLSWSNEDDETQYETCLMDGLERLRIEYDSRKPIHVEKIQLMVPKPDLATGWELHDIALIQITAISGTDAKNSKNTRLVFDEYISCIFRSKWSLVPELNGHLFCSTRER